MYKNKLLTISYFIRFALSFLFIIFFVVKFNYANFFIFSHIFIIFLLLISEFLIIKTIISTNLYQRNLFLKIIIPIIPALIFVFLIFLYISNIIMNNLWAENLHIDYLIYLAYDFKNFYSNTGVKLSWIIFPFSLLFLATYFIYFFLIKNYKLYSKKILSLSLLTPIFASSFLFSTFYLSENIKLTDPIISFFAIEKFSNKNGSLGISDFDRAKYFNSINYKNINNKKNIIIIFMDSARATNLPMYGYERDTTPFLNSLYKEGKLEKIDYFFSTCSESVCGAISTLSSKSRQNFDIHNTSNEILLQNILHKLGYKNYFISSCNQKADKWSGLKQSYIEDFDLLIDKNTEINESIIIKTKNELDDYGFSMKIPLFDENNYANWYKSGNNDKLAIFGANQIPSAESNPIFAIFWLFSSHHNGKKESEFNIFTPAENKRNIKDYILGEKNKEMLINRYDNGLIQTDYYISKIFELLKKKGHLDNSLILILGDHGDSFGEHGYYGHNFHLYNETIRVPLLIYSSDNLELKNSDFATQTDIAPTILDIINIVLPKQWEGKSLLSTQEKTISIHEQVHSNEEKILIMKKDNKLYKYFYISNEKNVFDDSAKQNLYELYSDPHETNDIINSVSQDLKNELERNFIREFKLEKAVW